LLEKAYNRSDWLYTAVLLSLFAGLRRKEILMLKWRDIDFKQSLINLTASSTKNGKARAIPIPDLLEIHLKGLKRIGEYVLHDGSGNVRINRFWYNWEVLRKSLPFSTLPNGLTLTFHDLRHVYAQSLRDAGINLGDIQAYLGHSSVELTVKRYDQRGGLNGKNKVNQLSKVYELQ